MLIPTMKISTNFCANKIKTDNGKGNSIRKSTWQRCVMTGIELTWKMNVNLAAKVDLFNAIIMPLA